MKISFLNIALALFILVNFIFPNDSRALSFCVELKKGEVKEGSDIKLRTRCLMEVSGQ